MLRIRYSPPNDLEISGSVSDLANVAEALRRIAAGAIDEIRITAAPGYDPAPYLCSQRELVLQRGWGAARIAVLEDWVEILASRENLEIIARYFDFRSDAEPGMHQHLEYYEGASFIIRESCPVVIAVNSDGVA